MLSHAEHTWLCWHGLEHAELALPSPACARGVREPCWAMPGRHSEAATAFAFGVDRPFNRAGF